MILVKFIMKAILVELTRSQRNLSMRADNNIFKTYMWFHRIAKPIEANFNQISNIIITLMHQSRMLPINQ
jgi:hypothetical protein